MSTCGCSRLAAPARATLPPSLDDFDWRKFQQEYRDYIDLAKLAQLVPVIGAPVGVVANNLLVRKLGRTAMNAYRMRWFDEPHEIRSHSATEPATRPSVTYSRATIRARELAASSNLISTRGSSMNPATASVAGVAHVRDADCSWPRPSLHTIVASAKAIAVRCSSRTAASPRQLHRSESRQRLGHRIQSRPAVVWVNNQGTRQVRRCTTATAQPQVAGRHGAGPRRHGVPSNPSGIVFSGGADFVVTDGVRNGPARFIFATARRLDLGLGAERERDQSHSSRSPTHAARPFTPAWRWAATARRICCTRATSARVASTSSTARSSPSRCPAVFAIARCRSSYAPFGIQAINGDVYVTYAKPEESGNRTKSAHGPGLGFVNVFDPRGPPAASESRAAAR